MIVGYIYGKEADVRKTSCHPQNAMPCGVFESLKAHNEGIWIAGRKNWNRDLMTGEF